MLLKERGMMMENTRYKFRAWQKYHKKMVEVTSISFGNDGEINGVTTFVENQAPQHVTYKDGLGNFFLTDEGGMVLELMQSTGLVDKRGVEIFEGDIIKTHFYSDPYVDEYGGFHEPIDSVVTAVVKNEGFCIPVLLAHYQSIEVIGNIYQNNDLI